jgi:hypothetical protein
MSSRSLPPPRGPCRNLPRRRRRPAAMLPPLPRTLRCLELAYGCRFPDWPKGQRWPAARGRGFARVAQALRTPGDG